MPNHGVIGVAQPCAEDRHRGWRIVGDGRAATKASFQVLAAVARDKNGNTYVSDETGQRIRKITSMGIISTYAGTGITGYSGDGGPASSARMNYPVGMTMDAAGNLIFADSANNRVRKIDVSGKISTFAGNGTACSASTHPCGDGGSPTAAQLNSPIAVAVSGGTVYIADEFDLRIRKVAGGIISTYAGTGIAGYNGNGLSALSTNLDDPLSVAVSPLNGSLYLVDDVQTRVRRVH